MMTALVFRLNACLRDSSSILECKLGSDHTLSCSACDRDLVHTAVNVVVRFHFVRDRFPQTNCPVGSGVLVVSLGDGSCSCSFDADRRIKVRKTLSKIYRPVSLAEPSHLSNDGFGKP